MSTTIYNAYQEYKESNVEWIASIPKHWKVDRFKYGIDLIESGKRLSVDNSEVLSIGGEHIGNDGKLRLENLKYVSYEFYKNSNKGRVARGDILIVKDGATIGKTAYVSDEVKQKMLLNEHVYRVVSDKYDYYYILSTYFQAKIWSGNNSSAQEGLNLSTINNIPHLSPSIEEKRKIANFLDYETAKIDILIDKQQQLIKLLKEKRQAVISHAVTKGLNPDAPMRNSGVEWLGEVPQHWGIPKIKWFYKTESGGTPNTSNYEGYYQDGDIPWIRTTDLNNGELFETPVSITEKAVIDSACSTLPINSVLVAMYGGAGTIGKHSILKFKSTINQAVCAILPNDKIIPEYLHLYVEFYRPYWMVGAEGTRKDPNINQEVVRELMVPCPSNSEQVDIVKFTKNKLAVIDGTVSKSELNIKLMQERRTTLISAAVTGKIDVRNWVAPESSNTNKEVA